MFDDAIPPSWPYVRAVRQRLLADSDWTQLPDAALTPERRAAWADYRAALRDITTTAREPADVVWPVKPQ